MANKISSVGEETSLPNVFKEHVTSLHIILINKY